MLEKLISAFGLWGILLAALIMMLLIWLSTEAIKRFGPKQSIPEGDWKQSIHVVVTGKRTHGRTYYATFQNDQNEREELELPGESYGLIAEGDHGTLTKVDAHFAGFERE